MNVFKFQDRYNGRTVYITAKTITFAISRLYNLLPDANDYKFVR